MVISFRRDVADHIAANEAILLHHPLAFGRWLIPFAMLAVLVVVLPIRVILGKEKVEDLLYLAWLGWPILSYLFLVRRWRKDFAKSEPGTRDMVATIDERGITLACQGEHRTHYWSGFSKIYESRGVLMLEERDGRYIYLPKRALSAAELSQFSSLMPLATNCKVKLAEPE